MGLVDARRASVLKLGKQLLGVLDDERHRDELILVGRDALPLKHPIELLPGQMRYRRQASLRTDRATDRLVDVVPRRSLGRIL